MKYYNEIDIADRGLVPTYPFSAGRSVVYANHLIAKHRYLTNRNAVIEVWDVYTDITGKGFIERTFKTLKAAKAYIYKSYMEKVIINPIKK